MAVAAPGRDPAVQAVVLETRAAPSEFGADVLLRLAGSGRITDDQWRRELIEEAYLRAYAASDAHRVTAVQTPPDSRQGAEVVAADTALTRLSLQVRAAHLMAFVNPARAREMFEWIDLDLAPGTCDSPIVSVADEYYTALAAIARGTFGRDTQGRSDALRFLNMYMWRAHLPTEMPALARALRAFRPTADEAIYLEGTFRWILESSLKDARSFSTVSIDLVQRVMELEDADHNLGITNWDVALALRDYLVAQFRSARCADSLSDATAADAFNQELKRRNIGPEVVAPLTNDDTRPARMLGVARVDPYWRTIEARRLYEMGAPLRGRDKNPPSLQERNGQRWLAQAEELLTDLERWNGSRESLERDYLYQQGVLYTLLVDLIPPTPLRTRALRSYVTFLRHTDRDRSARTLWFAFANRFIDLTRSPDRSVVLDLLEQSHHPVLSLYGRTERMLGVNRYSEASSGF